MSVTDRLYVPGKQAVKLASVAPVMGTELLYHWNVKFPDPPTSVEFRTGHVPVQFNSKSGVDMDTMGHTCAEAIEKLDINKAVHKQKTYAQTLNVDLNIDLSLLPPKYIHQPLPNLSIT